MMLVRNSVTRANNSFSSFNCVYHLRRSSKQPSWLVLSSSIAVATTTKPQYQSFFPSSILLGSQQHQFSATSTINQEPIHPSQLVNPPESTRPAPIDIPEREPGQSVIGYYFKLGKGYLTFYKDGLKNVYRNFLKTRPLEAQITKAGSITDLTEQNDSFNRAEFQLVMRSRHDSRRIPLFVLLFMVCGEFTPLVVLYFSRIVPFNCRIPRQLNSDRKKLRLLRSELFHSLQSLGRTYPRDIKLDDLTREELLHVAGYMGIKNTRSLMAKLTSTIWVKYRVHRRLQYLELDDKLLLRAGGPHLIQNGEELRMAAEDRGIDAFDKSDEQIRGELNKWFKARKENNNQIGPGFFLAIPSHAPVAKHDWTNI